MWKIVIACNWNGTPQLDSLGWPCLWPYSWHQSTNGQPCLFQSRTYRNSIHPLALNNLFIQQLMGIIKIKKKKKRSWLAVASLYPLVYPLRELIQRKCGKSIASCRISPSPKPSHWSSVESNSSKWQGAPTFEGGLHISMRKMMINHDKPAKPRAIPGFPKIFSSPPAPALRWGTKATPEVPPTQRPSPSTAKAWTLLETPSEMEWVPWHVEGTLAAV